MYCKKYEPDKNILGDRIVVGQEEIVAEGIDSYNESMSHDTTIKIKDI